MSNPAVAAAAAAGGRAKARMSVRRRGLWHASE